MRLFHRRCGLWLPSISNDERITSMLGEDAAIWSVTVAEPGNGVVRQPEDLAAYRRTLRALYNEIKAHHGEGGVINVFPVMPASLAVETGRVWMPTTDLELRIYDQMEAGVSFPDCRSARPRPFEHHPASAARHSPVYVILNQFEGVRA